MSRPAVYTPELAEQILARLADGESLKSICNSEGMPARSTVHSWIINDVEQFSGRYALAREVGCDNMADEVIEISDDGTNDWMERLGEDKQPIGWQLNGEHVQRSRLRSDNRKWYVAKLFPKRYGERTQIAATDAEGNDKPALTDAQVAERLAYYDRLIETRKAVGEDLA